MLRGLAAMGLVYNHAAAYLAHDPSLKLGASWLAPTLATGELGGLGVDLFFIISGFVMAHSARHVAGPAGAGLFLARRYARIAPLFYLCSLVFLAKSVSAGVSIEPQSIYNTLTFVPVFDDETYSWPMRSWRRACRDGTRSCSRCCS